MNFDLLKAFGYIEGVVNTYFTSYVRNMFSATMLYKHHARKGALYFFIGYYVILDINKSRYFPFKFIKVQEPC